METVLIIVAALIAFFFIMLASISLNNIIRENEELSRELEELKNQEK